MKSVTMKDVAIEAGVSTSTVSHVINNTRFVEQRTKERVEEAMGKLSYVPNTLARSLRKKSTRTIGIIISDISNSFFTDIVRACEDKANMEGYNTILCNSEEDPEKEKMYLNVLQQKQVDGIIISPTGGNKNLISKIKKFIPIVFVDRYLNGIDNDYVGIDNYQAGYKAVRHLHNCGHKKIAVLYNFAHLSCVQERIEGYKQAVTDFNLEKDKDLFLPVNDVANCDDTRNKIISYLNNKHMPECIFVLNNTLAIELISVLRELQYKCPNDLAIMSVIDFYWAWAFQPYLSMIHTSVNDIGKKAIEILVSRIREEDKETVIFRTPVNLIVRDSCGALKGPVRLSESS
ncbi:MAG: LacI family DNA-binding transcriptional regulator [Eubacteriales bacterium]